MGCMVEGGWRRNRKKGGVYEGRNGGVERSRGVIKRGVSLAGPKILGMNFAYL